ncbi:MAG: hypothetical protein U1D30_12545 [Planctomycetota bacterium]
MTYFPAGVGYRAVALAASSGAYDSALAASSGVQELASGLAFLF